MAKAGLKKQYIELAAQLLSSEGPESISARRLAGALGCSPAALYRHFSGIGELFVFAAIHTLHDYYVAQSMIQKQCSNSYELLLRTEEAFAAMSFKLPHLFYDITFSPHGLKFPQLLREYLDLFDDQELKSSSYIIGLTSASFELSNQNLLRKCVLDGYLRIPEQIIPIVNDIIVNTYKGFLAQARDTDPNAYQANLLTERYLTCFYFILQTFQS